MEICQKYNDNFHFKYAGSQKRSNRPLIATNVTLYGINETIKHVKLGIPSILIKCFLGKTLLLLPGFF